MNYEKKRAAFLASIPDDKEMAWVAGWARGFCDGTDRILDLVESGEITREKLLEEDEE